MKLHHNSLIQRIDGKLHTITTIKDEYGNTIAQEVSRLKVEVSLRDVMQILVGASMLAIPTALTQEVWDMGEQLPWINIIAMLLVEYLIIAMFIYLRSYQEHIKVYRAEFVKRVLIILFLSGAIVGLFLALVGQLPLFDNTDVAIKRIVIGMLPASMSATVMDSLK